MRIGIDISQLAYENAGVSIYIKNLVNHLLAIDKTNEYILFFSSLRKKLPEHAIVPIHKNVVIKKFPFPPILLDIIWNRFHILPVEWLIGNIDVFISSDWTQPPTRAKKATILYDLIVYVYPDEMDKRIVSTQKRRLRWVRKEVETIFCISQATKNDARGLLCVEKNRLKVLYPGL